MIDRRTFNKLASFTGLGALAGQVGFADAQSEAAGSGENASEQFATSREIILEDNSLLIAFDSTSGALTRMERKSTRWQVERRPALSVSFRLHVPLSHRRDNFVLGQKQRAVKVEKLSNHEISLEWKDLVSEHGGVLPLTFTAKVTLQNGALTFNGTLINDSPLVVETIDFPYFGDLNPPARNVQWNARIMRYDNLESTEIYPHFANEKGYWGVDFPTKTLDSCHSLFCLLQSAHEGLYVGVHDPNPTYLLQYTFEQHPGVICNLAPLSSVGSDEVEMHQVPDTDVISGIPVHLEFRTCHFIFTQANSTRTLAPVVIRCYSGDWHAGIDLYKEWRATWYHPPRLPAWAKDVHSWQQLQINSPEEEFRVPYTQLIQFGEECAKNGVKAIQLVGWNLGGQDRGNPSQSTDPGLGTWQELHDAIAHIQAMGVNVILFGKFPWADMTTDWYRNELYKYATTDPYGLPYENPGYSYHTPTQLAGLNCRRFAVMDFLSPGYREIAGKEFEKVLNLGSAGWLYDEVCAVVNGKYNFASGHGYTAPGYIYAGVIPLGKQLRAAADKVNPDFLFAGEGPQDWLTQLYPVSYFRGSSNPVERYIAPDLPIMVSVNGFDDREQLNRILLYRYIISYEPYNFKGHLTDFPLTLAYGQKIDALRRRYKAALWDAEFRDTLGANVVSNGSHRYTVFVRPNGKRAVVIVNQEYRKPISATLELPNASGLVIATPEHPEALPTSNRIQIPARSAAVIME